MKSDIARPLNAFEFWKEKLNKGRVKGITSKLLEGVLEEKRREIIRNWIKEGKIKGMCNRKQDDY